MVLIMFIRYLSHVLNSIFYHFHMSALVKVSMR